MPAEDIPCRLSNSEGHPRLLLVFHNEKRKSHLHGERKNVSSSYHHDLCYSPFGLGLDTFRILLEERGGEGREKRGEERSERRGERGGDILSFTAASAPSNVDSQYYLGFVLD